MKKLLSVTAVLIAAALFFAGCNNAANTPEDAPEEKLPGTWTTEADVFSNYTQKPGRAISVTDKTVTFTCTPSELQSADIPENGGFYSFVYSFTVDNIYTGFKVSASGSSSKSGCGLIFCGKDEDNNSWSGYQLLIDYDGIVLNQYDKGNRTQIIDDWLSNDAIKKEPNTNEIAIYTDSDDSIVIMFNGTKVYTIKNPVHKKGWIGFTTNIAKDDATAGKTVTQKYSFTEFQTAK